MPLSDGGYQSDISATKQLDFTQGVMVNALRVHSSIMGSLETQICYKVQ